MTHIKRGAALLLCLCMALSLCACGGKGGEDTEADAPPREEGKKTAPPSDGPLPLSQYIQSSEMQILYKANKLDKDTRPSVLLFQDGTVSSLNLGLTFGELSKMSDEEIIQAGMTAEKSPTCEPCAVYLETDSTGNAVKQETLIICDPITQFCRTREFEVLFPDSGVIYDSTYTGYWDERVETYFVARGEQPPFVLDDIGAEGVVVDPSQEETWDLFCSFAWVELIDGTRASVQDVHAAGDITSCVLTGSGQKTLSLDDIQFLIPYSLIDNLPFDISPSVLLTPEGRAAFLARMDWGSYLYDGLWGNPLPPIPAHRNISFSSEYDTVGSIKFYNATDTEQEVQNLTLGRINLSLINAVEGRTGQFDDSNYDSLIREYGPPSGVVILWDKRTQYGFSYPAGQITYYWAGDGFYIGVKEANDRHQPVSIRYTKSGLNEQDLKTLVESEDGSCNENVLRVYAEINRLLAN